MTNLDSVLKSRDITLPPKVLIVKAMVFPVVMLWMWELDQQEHWELKNWCFQTVVLEKILGSHLDSKEIKPVNPKGNQPSIFIGRTDAEATTPILWTPVEKSQFIGKDLMLGKVEGRRKRGWQRMRWLDLILTHGHEFEQIPGDSEGQGSLACYSAWGCKESDMTEWLKNSNNTLSHKTDFTYFIFTVFGLKMLIIQ